MIMFNDLYTQIWSNQILYIILLKQETGSFNRNADVIQLLDQLWEAKTLEWIISFIAP